MKYLVTGGAGFIGANFVKYLLKKEPSSHIVIVDKLTYAGNMATIREEINLDNVEFHKTDICDSKEINRVFEDHMIDFVVNFAAESHVDRSIHDPALFLKTNILGTQVLLDAAKKSWTSGTDKNGYPTYLSGKKFLQVSTDEVYGTLSKDFEDGEDLTFTNQFIEKAVQSRKNRPRTFGKKLFTEDLPLDPRSPYATSKASADMLVKAYAETYNMPVNITRCSNNYGPFQFPEKLIPLMIKKTIEGKDLPVYGDGKQVRDWLYVEDHCKGIQLVLEKGKLGEIYNIGGFNEEQNIEIVKLIIDTVRYLVAQNPTFQHVLRSDLSKLSYDLITQVQDRLGHDKRYAIDPTKTIRELGFYPETSFEVGIKNTIRWNLENQPWIEEVTRENSD